MCDNSALPATFVNGPKACTLVRGLYLSTAFQTP
jgi:hypothetical protein